MAKKAVPGKLPLWKKLLFTAALVLCLLLLSESLLRLCGYAPKPSREVPAPPTVGERIVDALEYFAVSDRYLGFRNRPNGSYRTWYIIGDPLVTTDEFGYRNGFGWPGDGESPIVLFLGDSFTFCAEVGDEQTGPSEVARLLGKEFDVRALNAGVRGYSTLQAKRMLIESLERFPEIKVVVYTFCGNDVQENVVPNLRYPFKAPYLQPDEKTGTFREVEISDPVVPWGGSFYGWEAPRPTTTTTAKVANWLETRSVLCHRCLIGWRRIDFGRFRRMEFPDGKHVVPPSDYHKWYVWAVNNGGNEALQQLLSEMDQACRLHGAAFVVTSAFDGRNPQHARAFSDDCAANCAAAGVRFASVEQEFTARSSSYAALRTDGQQDGHYGPLGTKTCAKALAPALREILRSQQCPPAKPKG